MTLKLKMPPERLALILVIAFAFLASSRFVLPRRPITYGGYWLSSLRVLNGQTGNLYAADSGRQSIRRYGAGADLSSVNGVGSPMNHVWVALTAPEDVKTGSQVVHHLSVVLFSLALFLTARNLGIHWTSSLAAVVAATLLFFPFRLDSQTVGFERLKSCMILAVPLLLRVGTNWGSAGAGVALSILLCVDPFTLPFAAAVPMVLARQPLLVKSFATAFGVSLVAQLLLAFIVFHGGGIWADWIRAIGDAREVKFQNPIYVGALGPGVFITPVLAAAATVAMLWKSPPSVPLMDRSTFTGMFPALTLGAGLSILTSPAIVPGRALLLAGGFLWMLHEGMSRKAAWKTWQFCIAAMVLVSSLTPLQRLGLNSYLQTGVVFLIGAAIPTVFAAIELRFRSGVKNAQGSPESA